MAKLMAYTVTSKMTNEAIKQAVLKNLQTQEKLNNTEAFALTFDNNTKKLYMIFSEKMVASNANMNEHMVEIKADTSAVTAQIESLRALVEDMSGGDGGVLGGVSEVDLSSYYTKSECEAKLSEIRSQIPAMPELNDYYTKSEVEAKLEGKADKESVNVMINSIENSYATKRELAEYATKAELNAAQLGGGSSEVNLSEYATKSEVSDTYATKSEVSDTYATKSEVSDTYATKEQLAQISSGGVVSSEAKSYDKFVVVGVWGQSNAVGYDEGEVNAFDVPVNENRIFQISAIDNTLKPLTYCAENLQNMNTVIPQGFVANGMSPKPQAGTKGIHLPLANLICSAVPDDYGVIIVPYAYGGQAISYFANSARVSGFTDNIKKALDLNSANVFAGIIWCQGENNSGNTTGASYKSAFEALINDVNSKLQAYANRTSGNSITAKNWYFYEYPVHYRNMTYGREIMNAIKEVVGEANYIALRENHPVNTTKYTSGTMAAHYAGDFYRTDIAPKVFKAMSNNGVFFANSRDEVGGYDDEALKAKIAELESTNQTLSTNLDNVLAKINEILENMGQEPLEKEELENALRALTSNDVSVGYWKTKQPTAVVDNGTLTIGNGGGAGAIMLPANVTHFEGTTNGKNFIIMVAGDDNGGLGFFAQAVSNNQFYWAKSNSDAGFSNTAVAGRTNASNLASARLVIDIEGSNVKVMLGEQVLFSGDVSGGLGNDSTYTTPRIGFGASWSGSNPGNIVFSDCKIK